MKVCIRRISQFIKQGDVYYVLQRAVEHIRMFYAIKEMKYWELSQDDIIRFFKRKKRGNCDKIF